MKYRIHNEGLDKRDKFFFGLVLTLAMLVLIITFAGCASIPLDRQWRIASDGYSIALSGMNSAYEVGVISETQFIATVPYQAISSEALDVMEAAALAKDADRYKAAKAQLKHAIKRIAEVIESWK